MTETKTETKDKNKLTTEDIVYMINNKMHTIDKLFFGVEEVRVKAAEKIELTNKLMCELQYDNRWLELAELEKINVIIDKVLNAVWNMICGENRINSEEIKSDKHEDIDGYVSRLIDVMNNKKELVNKITRELDNIMSEIMNDADRIDEMKNKVSELDFDMLCLINDKLKEILKKSRKNLR